MLSDIETEEDGCVNEYFASDIFKKIENMMYLFPLWSRILLQSVPLSCDTSAYVEKERRLMAGVFITKIVAEFRGMHVSPAKHSYGSVTDGRTDRRRKKWSLCVAMLRSRHKNWGEVNWLFNVTINDISVIYVTAHRCAGGLQLDIWSGSHAKKFRRVL